MARLWSCGFELQSATALMEWDVTGAGTPTISTTTKRSGAAALRINPSAAQMNIEHQLDASGTVKQTFHRFYIYIATAPSVTTAVYAIGQSGFFPTYLRLSNARTLQLYDGNTAAAVGSASAALALNTWYRVEIDHNDGAAGTATVTAYLDGVSFGTGAISVINGFSRVRMGIYNLAATADLFFDDWAINDTSGSAQTGLPGAGSIVHLYPNAAGDGNTWQTSAGGAGSSTNSQAVDEVTPDDATTYLKRIATTIKVDDYNVESSASKGIGSGDAITLVALGVRGGAISATAATDRDILLRLKSQASGTVVKSATSVNRLNTATWTTHTTVAPRNHKLVSYTDPQAGGAWTAAKLDTMQIGMENQTSVTTEVRVSAVWALVEYVPVTTITHALGLITVSETPQAITRRKLRNIGLVAESNAPQALTRRKLRNLGLVAEANAPQTISRRKLRNIGLVSESETPQAPTRLKVRSIGLATETNASQAISRRKLRNLGLVSESEAAQLITRRKLRAIGLATETDTPLAVVHYKVRVLGLITETEVAQLITRSKLRPLGLAQETNAAMALLHYKVKHLGLAEEHVQVRALLTLAINFKDIALTVGPTRLRERVTIGATRIAWDIDVTRLSWAIVETTVRRVVELDETRSRAQATIAATRGSTEVGATRLGVDIAQTRIERGER